MIPKLSVQDRSYKIEETQGCLRGMLAELSEYGQVYVGSFLRRQRTLQFLGSA